MQRRHQTNNDVASMACHGVVTYTYTRLQRASQIRACLGALLAGRDVLSALRAPSSTAAASSSDSGRRRPA